MLRMLRKLFFIILLGQLAGFVAGKAIEKLLRSQSVGEDRVNAVAIYGGSETSFTSDRFSGGNIKVVMGAVELDLGECSIAHPPVILDVSVFMGAAEIRVPEEWTVKVAASSRFGVIENNTLGASDSSSRPPDLLVMGGVKFGAIEIGS